ncbi:MAG TPA: alpha-ketoglutarate-dependent dioxygenase AlkB [Candidatus Paceibacterota bacterium]|nr:alpha-ketoglutarate-dependent dioxygenase AlkB [Candidatus Paceibacterota bacterium]
MEQLDLFPATVRAPHGFLYQPDFITIEEERELLRYLNGLKLKNYEHGEYVAKRKVRWFSGAMPAPLALLRDRIALWSGKSPGEFTNALVSKYEPGAPIGWHRDRPPYRAVFGVSLGSECRFRLRKREGQKWKRFTQVASARSVYLMSASARTHWQHSIPAVEALRYSITFRI